MSLWVSSINRGTVSSQRSCQEYPRASAAFRLAWVNSWQAVESAWNRASRWQGT